MARKRVVSRTSVVSGRPSYSSTAEVTESAEKNEKPQKNLCELRVLGGESISNTQEGDYRFFIECTNILWKYVKRLGLASEDARVFVEQLGQLTLIAYSTESLMVEALDIAVANDLTAYDAAYVASAQQLVLPLITADARLARALAGTTHNVRWLGDEPVLPA